MSYGILIAILIYSINMPQSYQRQYFHRENVLICVKLLPYVYVSSVCCHGSCTDSYGHFDVKSSALGLSYLNIFHTNKRNVSMSILSVVILAGTLIET